jgi:hypothetical protein
MLPLGFGRGLFTFSLDFELGWGTRGRPKAPMMPPFFRGTRSAIRGLLGLFERHGISGTWAVVGALLLQSKDGRTRHPWLADPRFQDVPAGDSASQPFWYADDVLDALLECPVPQEIGCHTLTHTFVDPQPTGRDRFREELRLFLELSGQLGLERPTSFIFPKAKMGHFDVLAEMGFRSFRGPERKWFESLPGEVVRAGVRLLDARMAARPRVDRPRLTGEGLWMIPASQFYSPFMSVGKYVSLEARVQTAIKGLRLAARTGNVFHLWTHPFNLGVRSEELLIGLDRILGEAARLRDAGEIDILPMGEIARRLDKEKVKRQKEKVALSPQPQES